jgi:hypothetical protein
MEKSSWINCKMNGCKSEIVWSDRMTKTKGKILPNGTIQLSSLLVKSEKDMMDTIESLKVKKISKIDDITIQWCGKMTKTKAIITGMSSVKASSRLIKDPEDLKLAISSLFASPQILTDSSNQKWVKGAKIGAGGFSTVFTCKNDTKVVLKIDQASSDHEVKIYRQLGTSISIPALLGYGTTLINDKLTTFLVLERFKVDARVLLKTNSIDDRLGRSITREIIGALKFIHGAELVHCDLKPHNILFDGTRAVLTDFGLTRSYAETGQYAVDKQMKRFGTLSYMSCDVHDRVQPSRRSDMESFGWVIVELFRGVLPWRSIAQETDKIGSMKRSFKAVEFIAEFIAETKPTIGNVQQITEYFQNVWCLEYEAEPDYDQLSNLFA